MSQKRHIVPMLPDGNCLFRSVAHQLVRDADQLRHATVSYATQYGEVLKGYLPQGDGNGIALLQHHLERMRNLGCWGTDFELKTMASMLNLPIYILTDSLVSGELRWTRFDPWASTQKDTSLGCAQSTTASWVAGVLQRSDQPQWVEICYSNSSHYDNIQFTESAGLHSPPVLSRSSSPAVSWFSRINVALVTLFFLLQASDTH